MFATPLLAKHIGTKQAPKRVREPFASLSPNKRECQRADESPKAVISMQLAVPEATSNTGLDGIAEDGAVVHLSVLQGVPASPSSGSATDRKLARSKAALCEKAHYAAHDLTVAHASTSPNAAHVRRSARSQQADGSMLAVKACAALPTTASDGGPSQPDSAELHCFRGPQTRAVAAAEPLGPFLPPHWLRNCKSASQTFATPPRPPLASTAARAGAADVQLAEHHVRGGTGQIATLHGCNKAIAHAPARSKAANQGADEEQGGGDGKELEAYVVDEQDAVRPAAKQECRSVDLGLGCVGLGVACIEAAMPWWFRSSTEQKVIG